MSGFRYEIDGAKVQSVTTIMSKALSKPALTTWASKTTAAYAVDHWRELARLPVSERLKRLEAAPWSDRDNAALKGTAIHKLAEKLQAGADPAGLDPKHSGPVKACAAFLRVFQVEPLYSEVAVFSRRYSYAGTADLIGMIGSQAVIFDYKTNRSGLFPDVAYQLCAYSRCDVLLDGEAEKPMPTIDKAIAVHLRDDGYSAVPVLIDDDVFDVFLALQRVSEAMPENYLGSPLSDPEYV
jgi:hypothetical protein